MKKTIDTYIYTLLKAILVIFFVFGLFFSNSVSMVFDILSHGEQKGFFMLILWGYIVVGAIAFFVFNKLKSNTNEIKTLLILFIIAFIPRLVFSFVNMYEPISDFTNYFQFGKYMVEKNYGAIEKIVEAYRIPKFGGLAVMSGIIAKIFSVKLIGFQLANCLITSSICILIYLIGKNYDRNVGIVGCLLYSFYPANIISSLITTNHHGAVLFTLLGIYLFVIALNKKGLKGTLFAILSGGAYCLSDLIHPSVIVPLIAVVCFAIMAIFTILKKKKDCIEIIKKIFSTIFSYLIILQIILHVLLGIGIISNLNSSSALSKILVGMNYETRGGYSNEDAKLISSLPADKQSRQELKIIVERVRSHSLGETFLLFKDKMSNMWWGLDSYFWWYRAGMDERISSTLAEKSISEIEIKNYDTLTEFLSSASFFDLIYMRAVFIFALCGCILRKRSAENKIIDLLVWTLLGWISIHIFIEVQSRYRHLGTPYIFILASIGIVEILNWIKLHKKGDSIKLAK